MLRILITGARNPTSLELARLLAGKAVCIWLADSLQFPMGRYSRYVQGYIRTPTAALDTDAYIDFLKKAVKQYEINLLIPTYEEALYIANYRHHFDGICDVFCDDFEKLKSLHNKFTFIHQTANCTIKAPPTFLLETARDVALLQEDAMYYVFKPVFSRFATKVLIGPKQKQFRTLNKSQDYPWVAQWYVRGTEYCSYSIAYHGEVKAHVTYVHPYNLGKGSGIYYQQVNQPMIEAYVQEFCRKHQYHGQIGMDFILDEKDNRFYVIECNPRTVNGLHLFDPSDRLVQAFLGKNKPMIKPINLQPRMNLLTFATYNCLRAIRSRQFMQWGKDLLKAKDVIFRWHDPLPMLAQNLTLLEFIWLSFKYKVVLADAISYDTAWKGKISEKTLADEHHEQVCEKE